MDIRPIETKYKGYRFRSRLEARWAVFFDTANIAWDYECEGYNVSGKYYLPDFYLPEHVAFFEVKGTADCDEQLLQDLATLTNKPVILAVGTIPELDDDKWSGLRVFVPPSEHESDESVYWGDNDTFLRCDGCGRIHLMNRAYSTLKDGCCVGDRLMPVQHAYGEARSARFE